MAGERNPEVLAKLRDPHIKASEETIRKSLEGNWRAEHILALKQRLSLYRNHRDLIDECDKEIEKLVAAFAPRVDPDEKPMPKDRKQKQRKRKKKSGSTDFNMRAEAYKLFGVDLTQIPGLMTLVFMLFSEVGRDMSRWPTAAHFVSWLGLCPDNDISGGKVSVARRSQNQEPRGNSVPIGGSLVASRSDTDGRLSPPHESQTRSGCRHHGDRA